MLEKELIQIKKFSDLEQVNDYIVNQTIEMNGYHGKWEFIGCASETSEDGKVQPFYLLGLFLYPRAEWVFKNNSDITKFEPRD